MSEAQRFQLDDLLTLMARLRDPDDGCPWDLKQTFATIVPHTLEEVYEVVDTIEREDWTHLREELGDLLFQVVFYARLAEERGDFSFQDVVHDITAKLLRRHPHVFPDGTLESRRGADAVSTQQVAANWERIKAEEKSSAEAIPASVLGDVPLALPGMARATKLQKKASRVGFDWNHVDPVWSMLESELTELREASASGDIDHMEAELGDILFATVNLARHLKLDPERALRRTNDKFTRRFQYIEQALQAQGKAPQEASLEEMDALWQAAKKGGSETPR
ncbi:MAG: nucleoside triphosphate pyrophosphohydrolase [Natronospirillum sp.]|uniref:nucleoside triphosphate pyrophosphohydrolase n=1 Tax=Natronospirillum sp. TaxID=2812955 RepID=UPI0025E3F0F3|nr:nucleoside triphosphate pyrophosphohydrolase [Natronospirillum sp.]MCH8550494.1 nucleoside triphosphate pyrophosphohydrolase [Natronospirillum sp.]